MYYSYKVAERSWIIEGDKRICLFAERSITAEDSNG